MLLCLVYKVTFLWAACIPWNFVDADNRAKHAMSLRVLSWDLLHYTFHKFITYFCVVFCLLCPKYHSKDYAHWCCWLCWANCIIPEISEQNCTAHSKYRYTTRSYWTFWAVEIEPRSVLNILVAIYRWR